jgi:hypothetical protein
MKIGSDPQSALVLTALERAVLRAAGRPLGESAAAFHAQVEQARVLGRTHSGVGFVTKLAVPGDLPGLSPAESRRLVAVYAGHPQLAEPAEFLIELRDGRLSAIEAYCYAGAWPADDAGFSIRPASRQ